jgi:hypothetical protein
VEIVLKSTALEHESEVFEVAGRTEAVGVQTDEPDD